MFSNRTETCPRFVSEMNCCASREGKPPQHITGEGGPSYVVRCQTAEEREASIQRLRGRLMALMHALAQEGQHGA